MEISIGNKKHHKLSDYFKILWSGSKQDLLPPKIQKNRSKKQGKVEDGIKKQLRADTHRKASIFHL